MVCDTQKAHMHQAADLIKRKSLHLVSHLEEHDSHETAKKSDLHDDILNAELELRMLLKQDLTKNEQYVGFNYRIKIYIIFVLTPNTRFLCFRIT